MGGLLAGGFETSVAAEGGDVVITEAGPVHGGSADGLRMFEGIRYATARRWEPPQRVAHWPGVQDATRPGARCAQNEDPPAGTPASASEDCLFLNVTAPAGVRRDLPVLVYLHGGGLKNGAGSDLEPRRLAAREHAVVVTLNYRLGVFGFYSYPGLAGSGTFGLQDQQAAMAWVRRNIAAFGGNAHNVTLFGESGGGDSVCAQLVSPSARGLFDRVMIQSGTCGDANPLGALIPSAAGRVASWQKLSALAANGATVAAKVATAFGCTADALTCLRQRSADDLLHSADVNFGAYWGPAYDTPLLPEKPADAIAAGRFPHVPVIIGATKDEATLLVALIGQPTSSTSYDTMLDQAFGKGTARRNAVTAAYPATVGYARTWAAIAGDRGYVCPNQRSATVLSRYTRTYAFEFADSGAPLIFTLKPETQAIPDDALGAYHGSDVPYLWDSASAQFQLTPPQRTLSDQLLDYLGRFAATGDPNGWGTPYWANVHPDGAPLVQRLAPGAVRPARTADEHHCALWTE
ncbi:para-nitrobenzyl esterase [Amycolatopsis xylanica]|uniref:Carboxylic ester hydrolase n=1 Tax=Amycolatopsis xylanica TaxID=589385 RepID=A0A1H2WFE0_9PSEU|nr:carboxylesterase family protein [Amycolatopsis xylanica]SDW79251.1 para-nitrobenzyl esterase [Amycolatopsis xylanica]